MTKAQTSALAGQATQTLKDGVDDLVQAAPGLIRGALHDAESMARNGIERARQASARVRDEVGRASDKTVGYIQDEPVKSVLIAAAAGALGAVLVTWLMRSRDER